jgi:AcrR family transcriptional regulator
MRHHFPTKVALLEAVLKWREDETLQRARLSQPEGIDVIRAWIASVGENAKRPAIVELEVVLGAEAIAPDHPAHAYFRDFYCRAQKLLVHALAIMERKGELRGGVAPDNAARILLSSTLGLQSLWLRDRNIDVAGDLRVQAQRLISKHI